MTFDHSQDSYIAFRGIVSERTRRVTVWCGAGVSAPAGLPTWSMLRQQLSAALQRKRATLDGYEPAATNELIRRIALDPNPWVALQRLQHELGSTSYAEAVRQSLLPASTAAIPRAYDLLWRLRPSGLLNLNLDRLATRSFNSVNSGKAVTEFQSNSVGPITHVLQSLSPFIYNMHGIHEDATTWVLTHDEVSKLLQNPAYLNFVRSVLSTSVVLFCGLSAEDIAVGGHLARMADDGISTGSHFWVSSRTDQVTDAWAERAGIRVIRYSAHDGSHAELEEMLEGLLSFVPPEEHQSPPPVVATISSAASSLLSPAELASRTAEFIRQVLNTRARDILLSDTQDAFSSFEAFVKEYDEPIHRAWYTSLSPGHNVLLGYRLEEDIARGAFGRVFRATAPDGTRVAIKLLHSELRTEPDLLLAFRRGVRSMSILQAHRIPGAVTYREASEIPAFVVMDWVEGANLRDAVSARRLSHWNRILETALGIARVIADAHSVPERVLHRDIRPANVMIEDIWTDDEWRVVLLDFDLSWHQGAYQHSVTHGSGTAGYLAPEQIRPSRGVSSRHASVDSFGLGMTLYFMISGTDPLPAQHLHADWPLQVATATRRQPSPKWRSIPARFARLLLLATRDNQAERLDLAQLRLELERLHALMQHNPQLPAADLVTEELAARTEVMVDYAWNQDRMEAQVERASGLLVRLRSNEAASAVELSLEWTTAGHEDRKRLGRWLPGASQAAGAALKKAGWDVRDTLTGSGSLTVSARCPSDGNVAHLDQFAAGLDRAAAYLRFE